MHKINLPQKLSLFADHWSPKIVGEVDGLHVKLVKLSGEFVMHRHDGQDELFLVVKGALRIHYADGDDVKVMTLHEGDAAIVPRGVEHKTSAEGEAHVLTLSAKELLNTGNVQDARTVASPARI